MVTAVGSAVADVRIGDHVLLTYPFCGKCPNCLRGAMPCCEHGFTLAFGGARPDGSSGGVSTGAGSVLNVMDLRPRSRLAILGTGTVGLAAVMMAHQLGAQQVIAVDTNPERLETASGLGATHTVDASGHDAWDAIQRLTGRGADYINDGPLRLPAGVTLEENCFDRGWPGAGEFPLTEIVRTDCSPQGYLLARKLVP